MTGKYDAGGDTRPLTNTSKGSQGTSVRRSKHAPVNIEDVFNMVSVVTSSNLNPPPSKLVLTPRSAEACLKLGINPEIIKIRDIDSFWEHGVEPAVQRLRHEAYIQRRYDVMKQLRQERKRLINAEMEAANKVEVNGGAVGLTPEQLIKQQEEATSSMIQQELARIAKMQKRQEKELEQMINFEVTRAKIQEEMAEKLAEEKRKEELRKKQQEKRLRLMAEERRLREVQKATQEEIEEQNRRAVARAMHEKEVQLAEEKARKLQMMKKKAIEAEMEKKRLHEEHKRQTERFFQEEQMKLRKRLEDMQSAEKKKQDAILKKAEELAEQQRVKRAIVEKRLVENMQMAKMVEEKRKTDFLEKQEHHDKIRALHLQKQEEERQLHAQEIALQEQRRQMILLQQRREDEKRAEKMLARFEEEEIHVQEVMENQKMEHDILTEKKKLRTQMKLENVERVIRVTEYKRISTLKKLEDVDNRIKSMLQKRKDLVMERRKAAAATRIQKEAIAKVMEEVRSNASKASTLISKALTGKVSLNDLITPTGRSGSANGKRTKKSKSTASLLGLNSTGGPESRNTRSEGSPGGFDLNGSDDMIMFNAAQTAEQEQQQHVYVSPYETQGSSGVKLKSAAKQ